MSNREQSISLLEGLLSEVLDLKAIVKEIRKDAEKLGVI